MTAGSRLTPLSVAWVGADGSRLAPDPGMFRDTQLNVVCNVQLASDGEWRCLPANVDTAPVQAGYFADSGCQAPAAVNIYSPYGCTPKYITEVVTGTQFCTEYYLTVGYLRVFALGASLTNFYQKDSSGACVPYAYAYPYPVYALGAEILPSTFVRFTRQ
jgi:hypothetical protein